MELILTILVGLGGMVSHFIKKKIKKEAYPGMNPIQAFVAYIKGHPVYTAAALVATIVGCLALVPAALPAIGTAWVGAFAPAFTYGYMIDSVVNKALGA